MTKWDGLLPISDLGSRPRNCVATGWAWHADQVRSRASARQNSCARDRILVRSDIGQAFQSRDTIFGVATWFRNLVSRHRFWCRDRWELLVCRDRGELLQCRDMASGVATGKLYCGMKWCHDTAFDVATQFGLYGVAT